MNRTTERRIIIFLLIMILLLPSVATATVPIPVLLLTGETDEPLRIVLAAPEVKKIS